MYCVLVTEDMTLIDRFENITAIKIVSCPPTYRWLSKLRDRHSIPSLVLVDERCDILYNEVLDIFPSDLIILNEENIEDVITYIISLEGEEGGIPFTIPGFTRIQKNLSPFRYLSTRDSSLKMKPRMKQRVDYKNFLIKFLDY